MTADPHLDPAAWREDLMCLVEAVQRIHPNPFYRIPEAYFHHIKNQIHNSLTALAPNQIRMAFARLIALLRDGHSHVALFDDTTRCYPLQFYWFSDGVYVVDTAEPYRDLKRGRLVGVGDTALDRVVAYLLPHIHHDNDLTQRWFMPLFLTHAHVLEAGGFIADADGPTDFVIEMPKNRGNDAAMQRVAINPVPLANHVMQAQPATIGLPQCADLMYLRRNKEAFWFVNMTFSNTLYIQYNRVWESTQTGVTLTEFAAQLRSVVEQHTPARFIIDLRHNNGGDATTYGPLLHLLTTHPAINQPGKLFALIGRKTFDAAVNFAVELSAQTDVIFAGEPTGGRPNHFGDAQALILPNSWQMVWISSTYRQNGTSDDHRPWIEPDIPITLSSRDYFSSRDPVLAAVLAI